MRENNNTEKRPFKKQRRRPCQFCVDHAKFIDYKDTSKIRRFVSERGKIVPRRISGCCAKHQRWMTEAVKRARHLALFAFVVD